MYLNVSQYDYTFFYSPYLIYFLQSTMVLPFYLDVVCTLSICCSLEMDHQ